MKRTREEYIASMLYMVKPAARNFERYVLMLEARAVAILTEKKEAQP